MHFGCYEDAAERLAEASESDDFWVVISSSLIHGLECSGT